MRFIPIGSDEFNGFFIFPSYLLNMILVSFFSSMDENLSRGRDIFGYTRKNAIFAQKIKYERKYRISKEV